ncbi:MAG TPA: hypothetical protein VL443_06840 [Cyclobacteriaceae bacterium]|jgi:hypothetical protein|nr:hypothetical protein [Cyclobacteriaceae bacterium]
MNLRNRISCIVYSFIALGLFSCDNEETMNYPKKYLASYIKDQGLYAYDKNGQIHDKSKIDSLVKYNVYNTLEIGEVPNFKVVFLSKDTVEITGSIFHIKNDTLKEKRRVIEKGGLLYLESSDTTETLIFAESVNGISVEKHKPLYYVEYPSPWETGYDKHAFKKECFYVYKKGKTITLPMINFILSTNGRTFSRRNNEINQKCIDDLENQNFLLVQKYDLVLVPEP